MQNGRTVRAVFAFSLLACVTPDTNFTQDVSQKPDSPEPLVFHARATNSVTDSGPIETETLEGFAARLLHHAADAGCAASKCTILVTDFVSSDGSTFVNGIRWADELTSLFGAEGSKRQVVDRAMLTYLMQKQNIPGKVANQEPAARLLGKKCNATVVLVGQARMVRSDVVELSARFLNVSDENLIGPSSEVDLAVSDPSGLAPADGRSPPPQLPPFPEIVNGERVYQRETPGLTMATCYYMPAPAYTQDAREVRYSGMVIAEAALGSDGILRAMRIVKSAPFGLNDEFIKTLSTWKCKPAQLDGKPVATVVSFEVNFRAYSGN